jgi:hypothetical protein
MAPGPAAARLVAVGRADPPATTAEPIRLRLPRAEMAVTDALFDLEPGAVPPVPAEKLSAGRRLTARQHVQLAAGIHPLTRGPLHPDAAPAEPRDAPGLRCGACAHRVLAGRRGFPK